MCRLFNFKSVKEEPLCGSCQSLNHVLTGCRNNQSLMLHPRVNLQPKNDLGIFKWLEEKPPSTLYHDKCNIR